MAVTVVLIGVILTVYLSILKRNGWIGKTSNYRCPNPQCKKVFRKPIKVKNQSNQKEIRLACPECGYDLGSSNNKNALNERTIENMPEAKTSEPPNALIENKVSVIKVSKESESLENSPQTLESKPDLKPPKTNNKLTIKQTENDKRKERPEGCNHHFGYLGTLPKNTVTPDECYSCSKLIDCFK